MTAAYDPRSEQSAPTDAEKAVDAWLKVMGVTPNPSPTHTPKVAS